MIVLLRILLVLELISLFILALYLYISYSRRSERNIGTMSSKRAFGSFVLPVITSIILTLLPAIGWDTIELTILAVTLLLSVFTKWAWDEWKLRPDQ